MKMINKQPTNMLDEWIHDAWKQENVGSNIGPAFAKGVGKRGPGYYANVMMRNEGRTQTSPIDS